MNGSILKRADYEDFIVGLYFGFGKEDDLDKCINRAYLDFSRTLHGISKKEFKIDIHNKARKLVKEKFLDLKTGETVVSNNDFDLWHKTLCKQLCDNYFLYKQSFSIGQAQKWINMTFKYIFTLGPERISGFERFYPYCHIPLDNKIIDKLQEEKNKDFPRPKKLRWSRISEYEDYMECQKWIRNNYKLPPLDVEFLLWQGKEIPGACQ